MAPSRKIAKALAKAEALSASSTSSSTAGSGGPVYEAILADLFNLSDPSSRADDLNAIFDSFFHQGLGIVTTRAVLNAFVNTLAALGPPSSSSLTASSALDPASSSMAAAVALVVAASAAAEAQGSTASLPADLWIDVGTRTLNAISDQTSPFDQATATLYELIGSAHEDKGDFELAAQAFSRIPLDSSHRKLSDQERAAIWVRIARNHLETGDHVAAETYVNKFKNVMHTVSDKAVTLHFRVCEARILDAKRDFLNAAANYHRISFYPEVMEDDQLQTLAMAVRCAVLAPAGPVRSYNLSRLYKDDRCAQLDDFAILEKMFLDRLLSPAEVAKFAQGLQPHQLATTADGFTVLNKAVVEHNLLGASRLYDNIRFADLGALLGLDPGKAEETTARMIEQGRLVGRMDQLDGIIWFSDHAGDAPNAAPAPNTTPASASASSSSSSSAGARDKAGRLLFGKEMRRWDANVESLAEDVESITNSLQKEFPDFVAANLHV